MYKQLTEFEDGSERLRVKNVNTFSTHQKKRRQSLGRVWRFAGVGCFRAFFRPFPGAVQRVEKFSSAGMGNRLTGVLAHLQSTSDVLSSFPFP
jgi:hypothetical protein